MSESIITAITATFTDTQYMNPDFGIILTIDDVAEAKNRIAQRGALEKPDTFEARGVDFQQRVSGGYLAVADAYHLPIISASQSIDDVASEIKLLIQL